MESLTREYAKKSLLNGGGRWKTICEVFRLIYDEVENLPDMNKKDKITELLLDGLTMAKKIDRRLRYYKKTYKDETGSGGKRIQVMHRMSRVRSKRKAREL